MIPKVIPKVSEFRDNEMTILIYQVLSRHDLRCARGGFYHIADNIDSVLPVFRVVERLAFGRGIVL